MLGLCKKCGKSDLATGIPPTGLCQTCEIERLNLELSNLRSLVRGLMRCEKCGLGVPYVTSRDNHRAFVGKCYGCGWFNEIKVNGRKQ